MEKLHDLVASHEDWLLQRILDYARDHGYAEDASTLVEAWRASVCGISSPFLESLAASSPPMDLRADMDFATVPAAAYGIEAAAKHRVRGVSLPQFLGLMKYYRRAYLDLIWEKGGFDPQALPLAIGLTDRFFDAVEMGFVSAWSSEDLDQVHQDLQAENRRLANEKNYFLSIFESLTLPVILIGDDGVISNMNVASHDLFVGPAVPGAVYYGEGDMPYLSEDLLQFIREMEEEGRYERILRTRHGIRQFEISMLHLLDVSGKFKNSVLIFVDVTERMEASEDLLRNKDRLADLVAMRTAETTSAQVRLHEAIAERKAVEESLQKTIDQLTKSNTELERFANFASHDLKESARLVASYSQLLARRLQDSLDDQTREFLDFLTESGKRMSQQVEDLLSYSRTQARVHPFGKVDSTHIVEAAVANLETYIRETDVQLEVDDLPHVWCDEFQIQEVFQHLIGNAIKFRAPDRQPLVHISCDAGAEEAVFRVEDNGIGIDPQYAEQIFVIFKRLHTKDKYPGSGIGLAMCKRIIERHGGRIWMDSVPEKGSRFHFTLPLAGRGKGRSTIGAG
ncbi:sensor histidine kinase [Magnetospira thiophila]